jgi:hypothetical protein
MKMRALKDYLHPYDSVIYVVGTEFDLEGDDALCEFLVGMGTLEYVEDEEPAPAPTKKAAAPAPAKPAPTKAELSSGVIPNA